MRRQRVTTMYKNQTYMALKHFAVHFHFRYSAGEAVGRVGRNQTIVRKIGQDNCFIILHILSFRVQGN